MTDKELENFKESFTDWENYYKETKVEVMPWYVNTLDQDLEHEIISKNLHKGKFLDLGTGPGTQAIHLAKQNFEVTGTDVSISAIENAKKLSNKIQFVNDDILNSKLSDKEFNYIFDRGVFHIFDITQRSQYVKQIKRILNDNGILFLKCMSTDEKNLPDNDLPHKLSKQDIMDIFDGDFNIQSINDTVFHGSLAIFPKALFVVLKKKPNS